MSALFAFFKKELLSCLRSKKLLILGLLFLVFGLMSPAIAKITPWLYEVMAEDLAEIGMSITEVKVDALTSWVQFFKNIPLALIIFVVLFSGIFTGEYRSGTLVLILTKGLARYKVVLAKTAALLLYWTAGFWLCFGVTYGGTALFWDNALAQNLAFAALNFWVFGLWVIGLLILCSVLFKSYVSVLLGTGGGAGIFYLLSLLPSLSAYSPTALMSSGGLLAGLQGPGDFLWALTISLGLLLLFVALSITIMNKKKL